MENSPLKNIEKKRLTDQALNKFGYKVCYEIIDCVDIHVRNIVQHNVWNKLVSPIKRELWNSLNSRTSS